MLSGSVINNIVMCVSNIESSWNDVQEVLYNKSSIRISNVKDFSYRERSVRGRIRSLKQTAGELNQESARTTGHIGEKLSRKTESLRSSLDGLQYLLQEAFVEIKSAEKLESLMTAFEGHISELECSLEGFADQLEISRFEDLRRDPFNYEIADEDSDYND